MRSTKTQTNTQTRAQDALSYVTSNYLAKQSYGSEE